MTNLNETKQIKSNTNTNTKRGAKRLARIALFTAFTAVCAQISIPLPGGVPITLQTLAVMFASLALGFDGVAAVAVYVLLGLIGVPVFSGFGATASLVSPTGGFIVGFLPMSAVMATITKAFEKQSENGIKTAEKSNESRKRYIVYALAALVGTVICYTFGTAWFIEFFTLKGTEKTLGYALSACVLPFIVPDLLKIALASYLGVASRKILRK